MLPSKDIDRNWSLLGLGLKKSFFFFMLFYTYGQNLVFSAPKPTVECTGKCDLRLCRLPEVQKVVETNSNILSDVFALHYLPQERLPSLRSGGMVLRTQKLGFPLLRK